MKYELAESILHSSLKHWDTMKMSSETKDIQVISEIKYDDYQQFTHGMRYIESLALWMRQFDSDREKDIAYSFVKENMIFVSEEEMRQLVMYSYRICMKKYLMERTKKICERILVTDIDERKRIYEYLLRCSMFLGLSDGAHIDFFRRQNRNLSNEQVFVHYDFSREKEESMREKLVEESIVNTMNKKYANVLPQGFTSFFLIDDFTGSGKSFIRKKESGWGGKIHKFIERLSTMGYKKQGLDIHITIYIATKKALSYIKEQIAQYVKDNEMRPITIEAVQIVNPINWENENDLNILLEKNYNKYIEKYGEKQSYADKHFAVGGGKFPFWGFGDCSLPLVLCHNTPNNSLPILWYSWNDNENALFPRVTRHKEM